MNEGHISKVRGHAVGHKPPKPQKTQKKEKKEEKDPEDRQGHTFTVIDAISYAPGSPDGHPIAGVPEYGKDTFGLYSGKYPYVAASKAFSNLQKHMKKFSKDWFPDYEPDNPPTIIFLLRRLSDKKIFAYQGRRKTAPQSKDGPRIVESEGRTRVYRWVNESQALDTEDTLSEHDFDN